MLEEIAWKIEHLQALFQCARNMYITPWLHCACGFHQFFHEFHRFTICWHLDAQVLRSSSHYLFHRLFSDNSKLIAGQLPFSYLRAAISKIGNGESENRKGNREWEWGIY